MNPSALEQSLARFNVNKDAIFGSVQSLVQAGKMPPPNLLIKAQSIMDNIMNPQTLIGQNRRAKGSVPIGSLKNGSVLYSDGSVRPAEEALPEEGNFNLPMYKPTKEAIELNLPDIQRSEAVDITQQFMNPFEPQEEAPITEQFASNAPNSAYQMYMEIAGSIPEQLRKEIDEFMSKPKEIAMKYSPEEKILASKTPVRYGNYQIPDTARFTLPGIKTSQLQSLISQIEREDEK